MSTWRPISPPSFWKRCLPEFLHGPVRLAFQACIVAAIVGFGGVFFYFSLASRFDLDEVAKLPTGILFCDRNGQPLEAPGSQGNRLVRRDEIPEFLVGALRAREDARFFEHVGIDFRGLLRATVRNIKDRNFTQGASTLSMQLARNSFDIREKSIHRKLLEMMLTLRVESRYSKDEILTHYLNRIYFGAGAYGIEQAAQTYFGKTTSKLSDSECALIVGVIRGPHIFSPFRNLDAAVQQRNQTLHRMRAMGLIDEAQLETLKTAKVKLTDDEKRESQTSYALMAVRRELEQILEDESARHGGLRVITTIDAAWQQRLETELNHAVEDLEAEKSWKHPRLRDYSIGNEPNYIQYAAITTESKTGATLALIGGRNFSQSRYDRTRSSRDLGSAFEPFVAAAAAEREKLVLPGKPLQTGRQIGPREVQRIARRCGLKGPFLDTEDLFRGAAAASPQEMSIGLATLGNDGKRPRPFLIRKILNASGAAVYTAKPQLTQAITRNASIDALRVLELKTGTRTFTGATASERDAWALRLGPSGSTAIWIGFDQPQVIASESRLDALLDEFIQRLGNP